MSETDFNGLVTALSAGTYTVTDGETSILCRGCGKFRKEEISPVVGDRVICTRCDETGGSIRQIEQRKNLFVRPKTANVDRLLIVISAGKPQADTLLVDKLIIFAKRHATESILCINKSDTCEEEAEKLRKQYEKSGVSTIVCSAISREIPTELSKYVSDGITVLAGQSGVGKSTIMGNLVPNYRGETGELSRKIERGKQTTRDTILLKTVYGGYLCDTPGFSLFDGEEISPELLQDYYEEFRGLAETCRFHGCVHINEPDCAVKSAVQRGEISTQRFENYKLIYQSLYDYDKRKYINGGKKL